MKNSDLTLKAYRTLKQKILLGELKPGEYLNEAKLVTELQISRTPLRQAILILHNENIVERVHNKTSYVKVFNANEIRELYETLIMIEKNSAFLATQRIKNDHLNLLIEKLKQQDSIVSTLEKVEDQEAQNNLCYEYEYLNIEFHKIISLATNNRFLADLEKRIRAQVQMFNNVTFHMQLKNKKPDKDEYFNTISTQHRLIIESLSSNDPVNSAKIMEEHVKYFYQTILKDLYNITAL